MWAQQLRERVSRSGCFHCVFIVCQVLVTSFLIASYALCLCMCVHAFVLALSVCNLVGFLLPALSLCVSELCPKTLARAPTLQD